MILYMAMTINGMIARENDDTPWSDEVWQGYQAMVKDAGNIIVGVRTYEIMLKEEGEFENIGDPFTAVVSDDPKKKIENSKHVFVASPQEAITAIKNKGFRTALLGGGAILNTSFIREKLVDEIIIDIEPLMSGKGVPFLKPEELDIEVGLIEVKQVGESNTVQLHYRVKN